MKRNLFLSISSLFLLFSCNKPTNSSNDVVGYDTGIPSVDLRIVYSGSEYLKLWDSITSSLNQVTRASISNTSYHLNSNMSEAITTNIKNAISFYGTSRQYAVTEGSIEHIRTIGKAVTSRSLTTSKTEYAVGDQGKITYTKSSEVSSSGQESSHFTYDYNEVSIPNLRVMLAPNFILNRLSGMLGSTKEGNLYYVSYSESTDRTAAYNEAGEKVFGITRTYHHQLFDLNTVANPRYNSIRSVEVTETNIDQDGIKGDEFYVSMQKRIESDLEYAGITENEEKRNALVNVYPTVTLSAIQVTAYSESSPRSLSLIRDTTDDKYTCTFRPTTIGSPISFKFNATKAQIDKLNETVVTESIIDQDVSISPHALVYGSYPQDTATISNNSVTFNRYLNTRITFKVTSTNPYLSIASIELH